MSGKGDKPRPIEDYETFSNNWDRIFGRKKDRKNENDESSTSEPDKQPRKEDTNS